MNDISFYIGEISGDHFAISEKSFASVSVMACTATATATVFQEVSKVLFLHKPVVVADKAKYSLQHLCQEGSMLRLLLKTIHAKCLQFPKIIVFFVKGEASRCFV